MSAVLPALWNAVDAAAATAGRSRRYWEADGVSIDSRSLRRGDLFIAIKTEHRDGHEFVANALSNGAAAAMVCRDLPGLAEDAPLLVVDDTMLGLERLGMFARNRSRARRIAITGSVGKTSTKMALNACLGKMFSSHASFASHNNHLGVPLTLARMPEHCHFGVFEIGMNHAGEISALSPQINPEIAVITAIAPAHLAHFNSTEDIARAKAEIFSGVPKGGTAIIHGDALHAALLIDLAIRQDLHVLTFGRNQDCDSRLVSATTQSGSTMVVADLQGRKLSYRLGPEGDHWINNTLSIPLVLQTLGLPLEEALKPLSTLQAGQGRGASTSLALGEGQFQLIDESYNANPASVEAALRVLGTKSGRKVAILGDMLELGTNAPAMHAELANVIEEEGIDLVFTSGPLMAMLNAALPARKRGLHTKDSQALAAQIGDYIEPADCVLVKGSLGSRMEAIVDALKGLAHGARGSAA